MNTKLKFLIIIIILILGNALNQFEIYNNTPKSNFQETENQTATVDNNSNKATTQRPNDPTITEKINQIKSNNENTKLELYYSVNKMWNIQVILDPSSESIKIGGDNKNCNLPDKNFNLQEYMRSLENLYTIWGVNIDEFSNLDNGTSISFYNVNEVILYSKQTGILESFNNRNIETCDTTNGISFYLDTQQITTNAIKANSNPINLNTWYQGESIKVNKSFNPTKMKTNSFNYLNEEDDSDSVIVGIPQRSYLNDSDDFKIKANDTNDNDLINFFYIFDVRAYHTGTFQSRYRYSVVGDTTTSTSYINVNTEINQTHINGEGFITIVIQFTVSTTQTTTIFGVMDIKNSEYDIFVNTVDSDSYSYIDYNLFKLDYAAIHYENEISYPRYEYRYSSETNIIKELNINLEADYNVEIFVYAPLIDNLTTIDPVLSYLYDSLEQAWYFITNRPGIHKLTFQSGPGWGVDYSRQSNIVALNDVSSDYMQSVGFENGIFPNDMTAQNTYDNSKVVTDIVSEGSFALSFETTTSVRQQWQIKPNGIDINKLGQEAFYFSFDFYTDTNSFTDLRFYFPGVYNWFDLETLEANRWNKVFYYTTINDPLDTVFAFDNVAGTNGKFWIDNLRFWLPSGSYSNLGLSEYEFSSQFIYWDGYKNPSATNLDVEWSLRDRTADTEIISKSLITDNLGYAYYNFQGNLEMKEYESRWWSWDSFFIGNENYENNRHISNDNIAGWGDLSHAGETISYDSVNNELDFVDTVASLSHDIRYYPTNNYDLTNMDYWTISIKTTSTTNSPVLDYYTLRETSSIFLIWYSGNFFDTTTTDLVETNYQRYGFDRKLGGESATSPDISNIDFLDFRFRYPSVNTMADISINEFKFIQAQKTYFTPIPSSYSPYAYETKQDLTRNYIDFSEGTLETLAERWAGRSTLSVSDGEFIVEPTNTGYSKVGLDFDQGILTEQIYNNVFQFRAKASEDGLAYAIAGYWDSAWRTVAGWELTTEYQTFEIELPIPSNGEITSLYMEVNENSGEGNFDADETFYFDFYQFIHKDTDIDQGYGWEFEEPNYQDGWIAGDYYSSNEVENGIFSVGVVGAWDGTQRVIESLVSSSDWDIQIKIRSDTMTELAVSLYNDGSWVTNYDGLLSLSPEWQVITLSKVGYSFNTVKFWTQAGVSIYGIFEIEYVRFIDSTPKGLYETEEYFYFQSENNSLVYYYELDGFKGYVYDNEIIWKNQSKGSHEFYYAAIGSNDPEESRYEFLQLQTSWYRYTYEIIDEFNIQVQDFSLSDYYVQSYIVASKDYNYTIKENGNTIASGSGLSTGTSIQSVRNTTFGILVNYVIEFTNSTDTITFTSSYSNAAQVVPDDLAIEGLKTPEYDVLGGLVSFFISTNWGNTTITVYQNDSSIGSVSESGTLVFSFSNSPGIYNFTYLIDGGSDTFIFEDWLTIASPDLSLISIFYDIVILDSDGYIFQDFPLLTYYNNTIISRNQIELRGNETFDKTLLTWGNDQGFSFNSLNVTILESFTSNTFVILVYLDLIKIHFTNAGLYTSSLNVTRTPGDYSLNNETILVQQGGRNYWLPPGNYSAVIYEVLEENSTTNNIKLSASGFISFMRVSKGLINDFDASSSLVDYNPDINNRLNFGRSVTNAGSILSWTLVVFFVAAKFGDEIWLWFRVTILRKPRDQPFSSGDFDPRNNTSHQRQPTATNTRRNKI